jgi:hypothetical protein
MKHRQLTRLAPALLAVLGVVLLAFWTRLSPSSQFPPRLPGQDGTPATTVEHDERELVAGEPVAGPGTGR